MFLRSACCTDAFLFLIKANFTVQGICHSSARLIRNIMIFKLWDLGLKEFCSIYLWPKVQCKNIVKTIHGQPLHSLGPDLVFLSRIQDVSYSKYYKRLYKHISTKHHKSDIKRHNLNHMKLFYIKGYLVIHALSYVLKINQLPSTIARKNQSSQ